jgi:hypothetical protein
MIWTVVVVLFVLWLLGFAVFHVAGGLIHLLLILAVIAIAYQLGAGMGCCFVVRKTKCCC